MMVAAMERLGGFMSALLPDEERELVQQGEFREFARGDVLIRQGEAQHGLFLVLSGSLAVRVDGSMSSTDLTAIAAGESVGEMSVLDPMKASAWIVGREPGTLWCISKSRFDNFLENHPVAAVKILRAIAIMLCRRLRKTDDKVIRVSEDALPNVGFEDDY
jgi:CRP-like cAMP-binding protein